MSSTTVITPLTITREKNENGEPLYPDYMRKSEFDNQVLTEFWGEN